MRHAASLCRGEVMRLSLAVACCSGSLCSEARMEFRSTYVDRYMVDKRDILIGLLQTYSLGIWLLIPVALFLSLPIDFMTEN